MSSRFVPTKNCSTCRSRVGRKEDQMVVVTEDMTIRLIRCGKDEEVTAEKHSPCCLSDS